MTEEQKTYWHPFDPDQDHGLCTFEDPEGYYRFYAKWDGDIHFWFYDNPLPADIRHALGRRKDHDYYWQVGGIEELDEMIARLQAAKETATKWFAERGKRWPPDWESYQKGKATIEQIQELPHDRRV